MQRHAALQLNDRPNGIRYCDDRKRAIQRSGEIPAQELHSGKTANPYETNLFYKHYPKYKNGEINKAEFARLCSLSYPTIFKYIAIVEGKG